MPSEFGAVSGMTSPAELEDLKEFYRLAPQCRQLDKRGFSWHLTWTCKTTQRPCGPKECPDHPYLKDLIKAAVQAESLQQAAELAVGTSVRLLESGVSRTSGNASLLADKELSIPTLDVKPVSQTKAPPSSPRVQILRSEAKVVRRENAKAHSRPHLKKGNLLRKATITFVEAESGQLRRWGTDCVFSAERRRPSVLEFQRKRGRDARFYFPLSATDGEVRSLVGSWFAGLGVHDEAAALNSMGSPTPYQIDFQEE